MTERIDHAVEARDTLTEVGYPASNEGAMLHALTHATLALVEQQRIANIIALRNADSDVLVDDEWDDTYSQIREALGLEGDRDD